MNKLNMQTATGVVLCDSWKPVVLKDEADNALDFVLTPQERDVAILGTLHLKAHVRRLNNLDTAQAVADELVRRETE